jgi:hypothetical protein
VANFLANRSVNFWQKLFYLKDKLICGCPLSAWIAFKFETTPIEFSFNLHDLNDAVPRLPLLPRPVAR